MSCVFGDAVNLIVDKTLSETKRIRGWPGRKECYKSRLPEGQMRDKGLSQVKDKGKYLRAWTNLTNFQEQISERC